MSLELLDGLGIGRVDHADGVVLARDGNLAAVIAEGDGGNGAGSPSIFFTSLPSEV